MANPVKAAKQMFDQFLSKHDPESSDGCSIDVPEDGASLSDARDVASKGGRARAIILSPKKRREIAKKAARARWRKPQ